MIKKFYSLLDESIKLELNISNLYMIFYENLPDDANFWWKMVLEEKNHASLLRSGKEIFAPMDKFPEELLSSSLQELSEANKFIQSLIERYREVPPTREEAFNVALHLEQSAGEVHYQLFMEKIPDTQLMKTFQKLNNDDKDHAKRISSYMKTKGIKIKEMDQIMK